ncbi:lmo0937 family membrane protein [Clostridium psychrophilum]|nr:lmo0937 family membrane protein [Clostridium psychrophilum]MBU3182622.1 lmo0937 family membrane protein [Clostridium psychrophilum]
MGLLRWLAGILIIFWLLGLVLNIGGGWIHILIVIAVIVFIFDVIGGRGR